MMMAIEVSTVKICGLAMLTTRMITEMIPMVTAGTIGVWVFGLTRGQLLAERQRVVARHREGQPDRRGVHGECADGHRDHDADQEDRAERAPHHLFDDVLQAAGALAQLRILQVGRRHHREHQDAAADHERRQDRAGDRLRGGAARFDGFLAQ